MPHLYTEKVNHVSEFSMGSVSRNDISIRFLKIACALNQLLGSLLFPEGRETSFMNALKISKSNMKHSKVNMEVAGTKATQKSELMHTEG